MIKIKILLWIVLLSLALHIKWRFSSRHDLDLCGIMSKIPKVKKFTGDDSSVNFKNWIAQYEAQSTALEIPDANKRNVLWCCLDSTAFSLASELIAATATATYAQLKESLNASFCGKEYRRSLESVLRGLVFVRGQKVQLFRHKLTSTIKELYGITDTNAVNKIAMNYVVANIHDDRVRDQIRILQLSGKASLRSVLELINASSEYVPLPPPQSCGATASVSTNDRLERLETKSEKLTISKTNRSDW